MDILLGRRNDSGCLEKSLSRVCIAVCRRTFCGGKHRTRKGDVWGKLEEEKLVEFLLPSGFEVIRTGSLEENTRKKERPTCYRRLGNMEGKKLGGTTKGSRGLRGRGKQL